MTERDWLEEERARDFEGLPPAAEHRIVGPPGTGKTSTLTAYAARGAQIHGPEGVAIASLTKAAAQEIAGRAEGIPRQNVGTLHAHAYRGLERPPLAEIPEALREWNLYVENRAPALRVRAGAGLDEALDFQGDALASVGTEGEALLAELATRRARMEDPAAWPAKVRRFDELWRDWKAKAGRLDFTDLIVRALDDLDQAPSHPGMFLLDEAQDLSALEFALARKWGGAPGVEQFVVCGDPDQNLYAWRGADPDAFWAGDAESERVLERSRRVPAAVQAYALDWIRRVPGRRDVEYKARVDGNGEVVQGEVRALPGPARATHAMPGPLLVELQRDLDEGRTVMVLASCAYMLEPLARDLRDRGIPYHNPYRPKHGGWNPLRAARRLRAFVQAAGAELDGENRPWTWDDVRQWTEHLQARGVLQRGAKTLIEWKAQPARFDDRDALPPADLWQVLDLLEPEARDPAFALDVDWWERSLLPRHARQHAFPCTVARQHGLRALRERPRLVLGTIHSVKGGEADSVYVFPDLSGAAWRAGSHNPARPSPAVLRLFYVAFTRARERLTLLEPAGAEYVALPRPGGGTISGRPRGRRLGALVKAQLHEEAT